VADSAQPVTIPAPVAELVAAWNDRSADRFVATLAPDVHVTVPPLHLDLHGRDEVSVSVARLFGAFGALRYTSRHRYLAPDSVTDEALLEGLQTQEFLGAPPPGRPGSVAARVLMRHDQQVVTQLVVWPDVAALRELADGVARRIDLRSAGPAAPIVAALRATIPAAEGKLSVGLQRQQAGGGTAEASLLSGVPPVPGGSGAPGGSGPTARPPAPEQQRGKPRAQVPKAPLSRKVRRLRAFLAGLAMLAVAALLGTYVVLGVRDKKVPVAQPRSRPTATAHGSARPSTTPSPAPSPASSTQATFDPNTNTFKFTNTVLFEPNSSTLRPQAQAALRAIVRALRGEKRYGTIVVTGYTDDSGPRAYNQRLSLRRARSVASYLDPYLRGLRFEVQARGKGEDDPAVANTSKTNRERNRRVEIKVPPPTT
jgi:OOP family OmpA-OmpF porin